MQKLRLFLKNHIWILCGMLTTVALVIPYIILGEGSIITYHDQLDGELMTYLMRAKYFLKDATVYPEFMSGAPVTSLVPPALSFVLLYVIFPPLAAIILSGWLISVIGFLGTYLLTKKLTGNSLIGFLLGCVFMFLPFYPVYGLCIPGLPLLLYSLLMLREEHGKGRIFYYLYVFVYSVSSSLVLVGFAVLLFIGFFALYDTAMFLRKKSGRWLPLWISLAVLLGGYLLTNLDLIEQVLRPAQGSVSHKSELVARARAFHISFLHAMYPGEDYTQAWPIVIPVLLVFVLVLLWRSHVGHKSEEVHFLKSCLCKAGIAFGFIVVTSAFYALYFTEVCVNLRNHMSGAFKSFNLSRVVWLNPVAWILVAAFLCYAIVGPAMKGTKAQKAVRYALVLVGVGVWMLFILLQNPIRANVSKILKGNDYYALDFGKFYAEDIFRQVDETIGKPKDSYKVVSLGIYPAAALYNGFYCLDGYSNNYPLEYKHEFRKIFEGEIEKSDYIREKFDDWGNRCYITTAEYYDYYCIERKWNGGFYDIDINTEQLKKMGCEYIFSATWILEAEELGLELLDGSPFVSENSWYNLYVYRVR